jgi:hypothetical protein
VFIGAFGASAAAVADHVAAPGVSGALLGGAGAGGHQPVVGDRPGAGGHGPADRVTLDADQVADVDDDGLAVVLTSGRRVEQAVREPSLAQQVLGLSQRRRDAARGPRVAGRGPPCGAGVAADRPGDPRALERDRLAARRRGCVVGGLGAPRGGHRLDAGAAPGEARQSTAGPGGAAGGRSAPQAQPPGGRGEAGGLQGV